MQHKAFNYAWEKLHLRGYSESETSHPAWNAFRKAISAASLVIPMMKLSLICRLTAIISSVVWGILAGFIHMGFGTSSLRGSGVLIVLISGLSSAYARLTFRISGAPSIARHLRDTSLISRLLVGLSATGGSTRGCFPVAETCRSPPPQAMHPLPAGRNAAWSSLRPKRLRLQPLQPQ